MKPKKINYYILHRITTGNNVSDRLILYNKQLRINDNFLNIIETLLKIKEPSSKYLYSYELYQYLELSSTLENLGYHIESFEYENIYYSIKITHILYPKNKIIIKDIYHFFSEEVLKKDIYNDYNALEYLGSEMWGEYNINIHSKFILSTPSLSTRIYKKRYNDEDKKILQLNEEKYTYIKKAYYEEEMRSIKI